MEARWLLVALPVVAGLAAAARWYWIRRRGRIFTVVEGRLFRSAAMRPDRLLRTVRRHGIRAVIDLRFAPTAVENERAALVAAGIAHFHVPSKRVPSTEVVEAVLAILDRPENLPALFHCKHGARRAALFEAITRMEYGGSSTEHAVSWLRWRSGFRHFGRESRDGVFLRSYVPRRERSLAAARA